VDRGQVEWTQTGLVLLIVGVLLQWIPIIQYLGLLLGAIAVLMIIMGSRAFGGWHEMLVWISVLLFIAAEIAEFTLAEGFVAAARGIPSTATGPSAANAFLAAYDGLVEGSLVVVSVISVSFVLIAFDLEDLPGRLLLLAGVGSQMVISAAVFLLVLNPLIHQAVTQAFASNPVDTAVLDAADAQVRGLTAVKILNSIPAMMFAGAYAWAHRRITQGKIPHPPKMSGRDSRVLGMLVAVIVLVSALEVGAVASGALSLTPRPAPSWQQAALLLGPSTRPTQNFSVSGTQFRLNLQVTDNGPDTFSFRFTVYRAGTTDSVGGCAFGGGPGVGSGGCGTFPGPGSYSLVVTDASGVSSWQITVEQLV